MPSEARTERNFLFYFRFSCVCIVYGPLQPAGFYNFNPAETKRKKRREPQMLCKDSVRKRMEEAGCVSSTS